MIDMTIFVPIIFIVIISSFFLPVILFNKIIKHINKKNNKEFPQKKTLSAEKKEEIKSLTIIGIIITILIYALAFSA